MIPEYRMREILAEECARVGFGFASELLRCDGMESNWTAVALAAMGRVQYEVLKDVNVAGVDAVMVPL